MLHEPDFTFHHLGLACRDLSLERGGWERLGYRSEGQPFIDPLQKVQGVFLVGAGPRLELLAPSEAGSPVEGYLARGSKLYHQGFEAADFEGALERLQGLGARITTPPAPAVAFGGRRISFLMTPTLNLIEIIEAKA
jgi:methylmalonyl-CoA/ethylmalonyl-CoA epimerase